MTTSLLTALQQNITKMWPSLSGSLWPALACSPALSIALFLALFSSLLLSLALSCSLLLSLAPSCSLALYCSPNYLSKTSCSAHLFEGYAWFSWLTTKQRNNKENHYCLLSNWSTPLHQQLHIADVLHKNFILRNIENIIFRHIYKRIWLFGFGNINSKLDSCSV